MLVKFSHLRFVKERRGNSKVTKHIALNTDFQYEYWTVYCYQFSNWGNDSHVLKTAQNQHVAFLDRGGLTSLYW